MIRWRAFCSYDGTDFVGWQSQADGKAVQDFLERALSDVIGGEVRVHGAGRTDSGVHARRQGIHFDCDWSHPPEALRHALENRLPETIRLQEIKPAEPDFHARFSATGKRYIYYLSTAPSTPFTTRFRWHFSTPVFEPGLIQDVLPAFEGEHDFRAFAGKVIEQENPRKVLSRPTILQERENEWKITVEGNGFLYRMVRCIVGTLVRVGIGRLEPTRIAEILEGGIRTPEVHTAPAKGLFLDEVFYPSISELPNKDDS